MIQKSKAAIHGIRQILGEKPKDATTFIKFLNLKKKQELEELDIEDKTKTILEIKKVLTKKNLMS